MISRRVFLAGSATAVGAVGALAACSTTASPGAATPPPGGGLIALADVPVGGAAAAVTASGATIVVAQPEAGKVVAFSAVCTHTGCTVAADGARLVCPCHGSVFDAATGGVLNGPATAPLPPVAVAVKDGEVVEA
jgi:Rieske Fe-S protein